MKQFIIPNPEPKFIYREIAEAVEILLEVSPLVEARPFVDQVRVLLSERENTENLLESIKDSVGVSMALSEREKEILDNATTVKLSNCGTCSLRHECLEPVPVIDCPNYLSEPSCEICRRFRICPNNNDPKICGLFEPGEIV